jgi:hypothetical protein
MVEVGQKVRFDPFQFTKGFDISFSRYEVTGRIVEVNEGHKWFSVEYGDPKMRTSFKFCDIGQAVKIVGRC